MIDAEMDRREQHWLGVILQSVGGSIIAILLVWIASNQVTIITSQAVLQRDFVAQGALMKSMTSLIRDEQTQQQALLRKVWPRLRTHGENIVLLAQELEELCKCKITLKKPEDF